MAIESGTRTSTARRMKWLGVAIAIPVVFFVGQVAGSLAFGVMQPAPHPVSVEIAGPDISSRGGRKVEVSSGPIAALQVCIDTCDAILLGHDADEQQAVHLRVTDAQGRTVARSGLLVADRKTIRLGSAAGAGEHGQ